MRRNRAFFHPLFVLLAAALVMLAYIEWMRWQHAGRDLSSNFVYVLPIIVPFVAFVFDRARNLRESPLLELIIDAAVVITAMMRVIGDVPFVSGHGLFLTYAIVRPGSWLTRLTAGMVMVQVIYLKIFVWHDLVTPATGVTLGLLAGFIVRKLSPRTMGQTLTSFSQIK